MEAWQLVIGGFGLIGSSACSFCAWYMKKLITDIEQIKIMLARHEELLKQKTE